MAKPKSKAQLLEEIRTRHERLEAKIAAMPRDVLLLPKTVGAWSVKDTIAHITAWEKMLLSWYEDGVTGKKVKLPDYSIKGMLGTINRKIFEENLHRDLDDVMIDFMANYKKVLTTVESIAEEDIFTPGRYTWTRGKKLLDFIWANTGGHYNEHLAAIERMKE